MKVKGQRRVEVVVDGVWREGGGIKKVVSLWVREEDKRTISSFDLRCLRWWLWIRHGYLWYLILFLFFLFEILRE